MFFDPSLSGSGNISCSSCHDPKFAYGPPSELALKQPLMRAIPSLRYLQAVPQFTEHYLDSETQAGDSVDNGPTGGLTWDGRVDRGRDQARIPLLSPLEMANESPASVVARVRKASYAAEFRRLAIDPKRAFSIILEALEAWQQDYREFFPYTSKYDAYLTGTIELAAAERRGLDLFIDPAKGNCARCHIATRGPNGTPPQFTDYGLIALGVPRNKRIPANADPAWYDLGACGPLRLDLSSRDEFCGLFKTPSLRNIAMRKTFFHNGVFTTLKEAIEFYVKRDTNPEKFDDMPAKYVPNIDTAPPFGKKPALTDEEIRDVIAFLETLTDGFSHPAR